MNKIVHISEHMHTDKVTWNKPLALSYNIQRAWSFFLSHCCRYEWIRNKWEGVYESKRAEWEWEERVPLIGTTSRGGLVWGPKTPCQPLRRIGTWKAFRIPPTKVLRKYWQQRRDCCNTVKLRRYLLQGWAHLEHFSIFTFPEQQRSSNYSSGWKMTDNALVLLTRRIHQEDDHQIHPWQTELKLTFQINKGKGY